MGIDIIEKNCEKSRIFLRPNASNGLWLCALVPVTYMVNLGKFSKSLDFQYKLTSILAFGLLLQSLEIFWKLKRHTPLAFIVNFISRLLSSAFTSFLVWICLKQTVTFSLISGFATVAGFDTVYIYVLRKLPKSFTLGEASIVTQGFILFLFNALFTLIYGNHSETQSEQITVILQVGLLGVTGIVATVHFMKIFRGFLFVPLAAFIAFIITLFPISVNNVAVMVLFDFVFGDMERLYITCILIGMFGLTVVFLIWFITANRSSNTRTRKYFHLLMVVLFIPGLIYQCTYLFLGSGLLLAILVMFETVRLIKLPGIHLLIDRTVQVFIDEKDAGLVAMTPIYLLVGCSMPIWLHPSPCDLTDSAGFELLPLMSGVLSVGIGDTLASVIGSLYGRYKWSDGIKTIEGTIASILGQAIVLPIFIYFGLVQFNLIKTITFGVAIVLNSLVETKTDQVDNLVLPLVTFIVLSIS